MMLFIKKDLLHELYLDDMQCIEQNFRDFTGLLMLQIK